MADQIVEEINATYEGLAELERDFEDVETEIVRQQYALTKPLYEKREKLVAKIPNFWPLVLEQAPPDVDQYIQPSDSAVLLSSLANVSVTHFELDNGAMGDPRSIAIKMEFKENDYFEDKTLEKKFWFRRARNGYAGLVSEPVPIKWKEGKDLTHGLLDLAVKVWENDKKQAPANGASKNKKLPKPEDWTADQKSLREKIDSYGLGGVSFFCFFGYRGLEVSAEESEIAVQKLKKDRADKAAGKEVQPDTEEEEEEDDDDDEENDPLALEIFPDGDDIAVAFSDDIWPGAIKYFTQAQEVDAISDLDFEEDDEEMDDGEGEIDDDGDEAPPLKKRKA
ncbi:nucleosome assembly protein [Astrocystis sublimbata]|nr:nucleosome assembly protein [Astrocystis sublimbata]